MNLFKSDPKTNFLVMGGVVGGIAALSLISNASVGDSYGYGINKRCKEQVPSLVNQAEEWFNYSIKNRHIEIEAKD